LRKSPSTQQAPAQRHRHVTGNSNLAPDVSGLGSSR
jgi:hypothetical protein